MSSVTSVIGSICHQDFDYLIPYPEKVCCEYWEHTGFRSRLLISFELLFNISHAVVTKVSFVCENRSEAGCVMSAILLDIVIAGELRCTTEDKPRGIRWTLFSLLLSHSQMILLSLHTLIVTYKKRQQDSTLSVNKLAKSKPKWWLQASQVHQLWRSGSLNWQALPPSHTWVASLGRMTGHVLRKDDTSITRIAVHWTPEGKRKRWCPKTTWRQTVELEMKGKSIMSRTQER